MLHAEPVGANSLQGARQHAQSPSREPRARMLCGRQASAERNSTNLGETQSQSTRVSAAFSRGSRFALLKLCEHRCPVRLELTVDIQSCLA